MEKMTTDKMTYKSAMSVKEMANELGISMPKAYELVKQEGFPSVRIGKRILIPAEGFRRWLADAAGNKEEWLR